MWWIRSTRRDIVTKAEPPKVNRGMKRRHLPTGRALGRDEHAAVSARVLLADGGALLPLNHKLICERHSLRTLDDLLYQC